MAYIIVEPTKYPIKPNDIDVTKHSFSSDTFKIAGEKVSAGYIVELCQELGDWLAFTSKQIQDFYAKSGHNDAFWWNGLDNDFVILGMDNKYRVTHEFVTACFKSSPATANCGLFSAH